MVHVVFVAQGGIARTKMIGFHHFTKVNGIVCLSEKK